MRSLKCRSGTDAEARHFAERTDDLNMTVICRDKDSATVAAQDLDTAVNILELLSRGVALRCSSIHEGREAIMLDGETAAVLRAVLDEVCGGVPRSDTTKRTNVASGLLQAIREGRSSIDELRIAGQAALRTAPSMWR
ncbi:hypothetical protein [Bradyrhizobium pachyrhizi]